jgi:hypothetical protein
MTDGPMEQQFQINIAPEVAAGIFADFVSVWHTSSIFVLDFAALMSPPELTEHPETGEKAISSKVQIVARVRVPPEQVFEIMKGLEQQLSAWERERGQGPPGEAS